jgi:mRNA-degrading endonuclease RelE of RelBE toxin-antitoxin system
MGRLDIKILPISAALMALTLEVHAAADRDTVELRFRVDEFVDFGLEEPRVSFVVDRMDPEGETVHQHHSGYRIISNFDSPRRVVASLSSPIPAGTSLALELAAPTTSSVSLGARRLGAGAVDVLHGVGKVHRQGVRLTYTFRADFTAPVGTVSPTITFSVVP